MSTYNWRRIEESIGNWMVGLSVSDQTKNAISMTGRKNVINFQIGRKICQQFPLLFSLSNLWSRKCIFFQYLTSSSFLLQDSDIQNKFFSLKNWDALSPLIFTSSLIILSFLYKKTNGNRLKESSIHVYKCWSKYNKIRAYVHNT